MTRMQRPILLALILVIVLLLPSPALAGEYQVTRVINGDTINVDDGTKKITVRLVGIDAPEVSHAKNEAGQPFSQSSTKHLASLVLNRTVNITPYGQDQYGRTLGEVFVDGRNINLEMIKAGFAEVYRGTPAPRQNLDPYREAEADARNAKRGMWVQQDKYISPREWRRMDRTR